MLEVCRLVGAAVAGAAEGAAAGAEVGGRGGSWGVVDGAAVGFAGVHGCGREGGEGCVDFWAG